MRSLIAIVLSACAPMTKYNITVMAEPKLAYDLAGVERAVEALDLSMAVTGLVPLGDTEKIIASKFLGLRWHKQPFKCGNKMAVGCTSGHSLDVVASDCVGKTAFTHELTHVLLGHITGNIPGIYAGKEGFADDPDPDHLRSEYWFASSIADLALREICTKTNEVTQ